MRRAPRRGRLAQLAGRALSGRTGIDALAVAALVAFGALLMAPEWGGRVEYSPDGLFYEAQKLEIQGHGREESLDRVFSSPIARPVKRSESDLPPESRRFRDPDWVQYSSRFYRRRWMVPALSAALDPALHKHSLETVSLVGYVLFGPLLYALLRRRFDWGTSLVVTAGCLLLPPLRENSVAPLTDSWGLSLEAAGLLAAMMVLDRDSLWLPLWLLAVLALSFTRDNTMVLVAAVAWVALRERSRRAIALAAGGILASLPAPLLFGASVRENLAYVFEDFRIPSDTSWGFILGEYPSKLKDLIRSDLGYPLGIDYHGFPPIMVLVAIIAFVGLVVVLSGIANSDRLYILHRGAAAGGLLTLLVSVNASQFRLELVLLPPAAIGVAWGLTRIRDRLRTDGVASWWLERIDEHKVGSPVPRA